MHLCLCVCVCDWEMQEACVCVCVWVLWCMCVLSETGGFRLDSHAQAHLASPISHSRFSPCLPSSYSTPPHRFSAPSSPYLRSFRLLHFHCISFSPTLCHRFISLDKAFSALEFVLLSALPLSFIWMLCICRSREREKERERGINEERERERERQHPHVRPMMD